LQENPACVPASTRKKGKYQMYCPELIGLIDSMSPSLSGVALKVLLRLINLSMMQGSNEVVISCRELTRQLGVSRDAITQAHRQLAGILSIEVNNGSHAAKFTLPEEWFPKRRMTAALIERGKVFNMAWKPDQPAWKQDQNTGLESRPDTANIGRTMAWKPGQMAWKPGSFWGKTGQDLADLPGNQAASNKERVRARRIESSSSCSFSTPSGLYLESVLGAVEISPEHEQDAQILREQIRDYRAKFGKPSRYPTGADRRILAQILAIAPIEDLCGVLRNLLDARVAPGTDDSWFVTTLLDKCSDVPKEAVSACREALKRKTPPMIETQESFGPELLRSTAAGMKNF
jgi:hypothetical protein